MTDIHAPGGIRNRNPSKRALVDPVLRPLGHRDRRKYFFWFNNLQLLVLRRRVIFFGHFAWRNAFCDGESVYLMSAKPHNDFFLETHQTMSHFTRDNNIIRNNVENPESLGCRICGQYKCGTQDSSITRHEDEWWLDQVWLSTLMSRRTINATSDGKRPARKMESRVRLAACTSDLKRIASCRNDHLCNGYRGFFPEVKEAWAGGWPVYLHLVYVLKMSRAISLLLFAFMAWMGKSVYFWTISENCEKKTVNFVMFLRPSVCKSAWNYLALNGRILMKFDVWAVFENLPRKIQVTFNFGTNNRVFYIKMFSQLWQYFPEFFGEWEMF